jgi:hypothetical protein
MYATDDNSTRDVKAETVDCNSPKAQYRITMITKNVNDCPGEDAFYYAKDKESERSWYCAVKVK